MDGGGRLVGRADVPKACGPAYGVPLFGAASTIAERFTIGAVTRFPASGTPVVDRAGLLAPRHRTERCRDGGRAS